MLLTEREEGLNGMSNSYADRSTERDGLYEDRLGWSGHTNTKTKRQIDFMALSS